MKTIARRSFSWSAVLLSLLAASPAWANRFYLSTEELVAPGEQPRIGIESSGLDALSLRVYRLPDPRAFLLSQKDLHRPVTKNTLKHRHLFEVLQGGSRQLFTELRDEARESLNSSARHKALETLSEANQRIRSNERETVKPQSRIPLLDYPLVARWRENLNVGGKSETPDAPSNPEPSEFGNSPYDNSNPNPDNPDNPDGANGYAYEGSGYGGNWSYKQVSLGVTEPGVYLVEGVSGEDVGYTLAVVTDLGVMVKQASDQTVCFVVDQASGTPEADVDVTLFSGGKALTSGKTDHDGLFTAPIKTPAETLVMAQLGESVALVDPTYYSAAPTDRAVFLFTDRPVYRPGDEVHFKGIVRDRQGNVLTAVGAQDVNVQLLEPQGTSLDTTKVQIANGAFSGSFTLPAKEEGPAQGVWHISAEIGEQIFEGEFKLKEFAKPDYQVLIGLDRPSYIAGDKVSGSVSAQFFHGTPLKSGEVQVTVYKSRFFVPEGTDAEANYFVSASEQQSASRQLVKDFSGELDANGKFNFEFETGKDADDFVYAIEAKVADRSGKAYNASKTVDVTVGRFYLQARAEKLIYEPGDEVAVRVRAHDYASEAVATEAKVEMKSERREGDKVVPEDFPSGLIQIAKDGSSSFRFKATKPGAYVVTFTAHDDAASVITTHASFFVTHGGDLPVSTDGLQLFSDKPSYAVGDEAVILIRAPFASASVLLTHEGATLLDKQVVKVDGYSAVHRFKVTENDSPNVFIGAAAIAGTRSFRRELGLAVPPLSKLLKVEVSSDKPTYKPNDKGTFTVLVTDHDGKPVANADVALSIVDESIYAISPEMAPSLPEFFYPLVRDNVRGTSSTAFRFYGYGRNVKEQLSSLSLRGRMGFGDLKSLASAVRKEFKDTLTFSPNLATDATGKAQVTVTFPENLTAWRATARVVTADTRVGSGLTRARVHEDFRVRIAAPRFFRERDSLSIGVLVDNSSDQAGTAQVTLDAQGLELAAKQQSVRVAAGNQAIAIFPAKVTSDDVAGVVTKEITLRASGKLASFADAEEIKVPRLPYGVEATSAATVALAENAQPTELSIDVPQKGSNIRIDVLASTGIGPAIESALNYLVGYPYGCTEQTMDKFVPDLVAYQAFQELKLGPGKTDKNELIKMVAVGVARLRSLQHEDGGWGWWPEDQTDAFMTGYVVQGLALAKKLGFEVPQDMLDSGKKALSTLAGKQQDDALRAYLLYDLALAGDGLDSMLDALSKKVGAKQLSPYAQALVSMALLERGKKDEARTVANALDAQFSAHGDHAVLSDASDAPWWRSAPGVQPAAFGWEQDPIESTAAALRALIKLKPDSAFIDGAVRTLLSQQLGDHWQSTRDTAAVVYALAEVLPRYAKVAAGTQVTANIDGAKAVEKTLSPSDLYAPEVLVASLNGGATGTRKVTVGRNGPGGTVQMQALAHYIDQSDQLAATHSGPLTVERQFFRVKRNDSGEEMLEKLTGSPAQDEELFVELTVTASGKGPLDFVLVEDPLGSGFEVQESDTGRKPGDVELHPPDLHREVHDEKVAFFLRSLGSSKRLGYYVTPRLAGHVHVMPTEASLMYHPQVRATSASVEINVGGAP